MARAKSNPQSLAQGEIRSTEGLPVVNPHAAGADIGAEQIYVCIPGPNQTQIVRTFGTYTADLHALADWLVENGIQTIAMESTGVYWIPLFEVLEDHGIHCCLISGNVARRLPARHKTDVLDCQWIQTLHSLGLLTESFRPDADLIALRTLLRHRAQLVEHRSPHVLHMQKALIYMNVRLDQAVSDPTGDTGLRIIRAIVTGERDPHKLAALRHPQRRKSAVEIAQALTGAWRAEHLFVLKQALELYDFYTRPIQACDAEIERTYSAVRPHWPDPAPDDQDPLPPNKRSSNSKNLPKNSPVHVRQHLRRITGIDLTAVDGLSLDLAQKIISEIGADMSRFPTEKHFCSWLKLAPNNQITGGKACPERSRRIIRSSTGKSHNRARQAFLQAAASVARSNCALGAFYRRLKARVGPAQAQVATAHKTCPERSRRIARIVYHLLKFKVEYQQMSAQEYEEQFREREIRHLQRKAARLGFTLTPAEAVS